MKKIKWSHSLDKNVQTCQRKAFYTGLFACPQAKDGSLRREVFLLKSAIDVPLWRGNIVHLAIQECILPALKSGQEPDFRAAQKWALELIDKQVAFSKNERYRHQSKKSAGNEFCVLRSDLTSNGATEDEINKVRGEVIIALNNLDSHFSDLLYRAGQARRIEIEKELHFPIDDKIQVNAKIDFLFIEQSNRMIIIDWKAGESISGNARDQLHAYAYAAINCHYWKDISYKNIKLIEANLLTGERTTYALSEDVDDRIFVGSQLLKKVLPVKRLICGRRKMKNLHNHLFINTV